MSDETTFHWPNVRRSFQDMAGDKDDSKTKCFVDHAYGFHADDFGVSMHYLRCADMAIWAQENDPSLPHPDGLFMPIAYLYRHSIELALKSIIRTMYNAQRLSELPEDVLEQHVIIPLWNIVRPVLIETWPIEDRTPLNNTQALLESLQRIDKSGQNLRYSHQKNGNKTSDKYPKIIRLELFKQAVHEVYNFITSCESAYYEEWQNLDG